MLLFVDVIVCLQATTEDSGTEVVHDEGTSKPIVCLESSSIQEEVEEKVSELTLDGQPGIL